MADRIVILAQKIGQEWIKKIDKFARGRGPDSLRAIVKEAAEIVKGGVARQPVVMQGTQTGKWWSARYPKYWRYIYFKMNSKGKLPMQKFAGLKGALKKFTHINARDNIVWTKAKRPVGRFKSNLKVREAKGSGRDNIAYVVYMRWSRRKSIWDKGNAWYARLVDTGTSRGTNHPATQHGRFFFRKGIEAADQQAMNKLVGKVKISLDR